MKILFLSHKFYPDLGGIEIHSEILAKYFVQAGHDVHLLTWSSAKDNKDFPFNVVRNPGKIKLIREHIWADLVFENNPSVRLAWPHFFINRPLIIALHTWISREDGMVRWVDKFKKRRLSKAKEVISCSRAVRQKCWSDAIVIENPYRENLFRILDNINRKKEFVFLGRLVSDKGAQLAIRAIAALKHSNRISNAIKDHLSLTIIGDGPERQTLEKIAIDLAPEGTFTFKGALRDEELVQCLNEHRFLIVPSVWEEPFGMVALEGMACGCIPIVSDCGGLPEAIGNAGLMFRRGEVDSLLDVLYLVLENKELENKLRLAASEHLRKHTQAEIASRYLQILERAIM